MTLRRLICTWIFGVLTLGVSIPLWGQLYTGSISGQVTDQSGAMIASANVTATDVDRNYTYTTQTDTTGHFAIHEVTPGQYALSVQAPGFKKYVHEAFKVDVATAVTVNATLPVSAGSIQIVVTETGAPLLQTEDASVGQTINRKFINDLPLVGRNVTDLISLTPGINPTAGSVAGPPSLSNLDITNRGQTYFVSDGSRGGQSDVLVDGVSMTVPENNGGVSWLLFSPNVDDVQEFKVQQGNFSAEYGSSASTLVNLVTRSGTNAFHGSTYDFLRNNITDARNYFSNGPLPPLHYNNYGGTVGGPIIKNKTFFFVSYDGWRAHTLRTANGAVPTPLERTGDFTEVCTSNSQYPGAKFNAQGECVNSDGSLNPAGQIWDPYTGTLNPDGTYQRSNFVPFNNLIKYASPGKPPIYTATGTPPMGPVGGVNVAGNLLDPVSRKMVGYYPMPNLTSSFPGYDPLYNNWAGQGVKASILNELNIKIDHQLNPKHMLSAKFFRAWGTNDNGANFWGNNPADPYRGSTQDQHSYGLTVNYNYSITPTTFLTISGGDNYNHIASTTSHIDPVATLGMPSYIDDSGDLTFPQINYPIGEPSGPGGINLGSSAWANYSPAAEVRHLLGSVTKILGKHELKFGAELRLEYLNITFNSYPAGYYGSDQFGSSQNSNVSGSDGFATFMMGFNDGWGDYEIPIKPATAEHKIGEFVQDNWKVTPNLTLNLGLRYDTDLPRTERYNRMSFFDPKLPSPLKAPTGAAALGYTFNLHGAFGYTGVNGVGRTITPIYWGEIQPRIGFAYRLGNLTSIRGGYGIYFNQSLTGITGPGGDTFAGYSALTANVNYDQTAPDANNVSAVFPASFYRNPYPQGINQPCGRACGPGYLLGQTLSGGASLFPIPEWNRIPQEQTWSLGIQRQLPWSIVGEANYIGKKGTHLYAGGFEALNFLPPSGVQNFLTEEANLATNPTGPNPTAFVTNPLYNPANPQGQSPTTPQWRLWTPYPQYGSGDASGNADMWGLGNPIGNSIYNSLQLKAEKRFSSGVQFLASYVWSKSVDDSSLQNPNSIVGGTYQIPQNPFNPRGERALSQFNIPKVFEFTWVYEMPFGRGKKFGTNLNRFVDLALGGWQFNGTYRWDDGQPLIISLNSSVPLPTYSQRPNMYGVLKQAPGVNLQSYFTCGQCTDVIGQPLPFAFGDEPRVDPNVRAPGDNVVSASLFKAFPLGFREGARAEFRLEFFNVLNHPVFSAPNTSFGSSSFGQIFSQANDPRTGQLALKLYF